MQCPKRLWLETHRHDLLPEISPSLQRVFDVGHEVGRIARERFPGGILVEEDSAGWSEALAATSLAIANQASAIFEGYFQFDGTIARPDVLLRKEDGIYELVEVKSNTHSKPEHSWDLAIQSYVYKGCGLHIGRMLLMHLNSSCRYPDLSDLFTIEDLSRSVESKLKETPTYLHAFQEIIVSEKEPEERLGSKCFHPYNCPFFEYCSTLWSLPSASVFNIPHLAAEKRDDLIANGILSLEDIPGDYGLGAQGERFVRLSRAGEKEIDLQGIRSWLNGLEYPLYFLDFETDAPAIPRLEGLGPYGAFPFQFSLHVLDRDSPLSESSGYLHMGTSDPRPAVANALLEQVGSEGSLIAYNAPFEKRVIKELAEFIPVHREPLLATLPRFADLLDVFRKFYFDPAFGGSNSIKRVLPVLCPDLGYAGLEVADGKAAQSTWARLIATSDSDEKKRLAGALRVYCKLDTFAMVRIFQFLEKILEDRN